MTEQSPLCEIVRPTDTRASTSPGPTAFRLAIPPELVPPPENTTALVSLSILTLPKARVRRGIYRDPNQIGSAVAAKLQDCAMGKSPWPLLLTGPAGTGKTCAALCLCDRVRTSVSFRDFGSICETVRQAKLGELYSHGTHADTLLSPDDWWSAWGKFSLAVVDEIGARASITEHVYECMKRVLDERQGKPLVLISNLDLTGLARVYDDRVASRAGAGTVVRFAGADRRVQRHQAGVGEPF